MELDYTKKRNEEFVKNWNFQLDYEQQIKNIMRYHAIDLIDISVASDYQDKTQATDFIVSAKGATIAARVRRDNIKFRDLTIRTFNNGFKTELDKIKAGYADAYLYCWTGGIKAMINEYILVNLDIARMSGVLELKRREIPNEDGVTKFIAIPLNELRSINALIAHNTI